MPLIDEICAAVAHLSPDEAVLEVSAWLDGLSNTELAGLHYDWCGTWARHNQVVPDGSWRSWGFLAGRRFGKTRAAAEWVNREVEQGRARRVALIAQNEDSAVDVQVEGDSGLIELAPPWFKPSWLREQLVWPNGAVASVFTPEKPGNIRGPGIHIGWATELQSWPAGTRAEAWKTFQIMVSIGYAKTIWDCTPKRGHPILRDLLKRAVDFPDRHVVVRGEIWENAVNLAMGVIDDIARGLTKSDADEELRGIQRDDAEGALWKQGWIDRARRDFPTATQRRIISIDPAISSHERSDDTGIAELARTTDRQIHVIDDLTGRHEWEAWGRMAIDRYVAGRCDCIIIERNRGGDGCAANLKAAARERGVRAEVIDLKDPTRWEPSTVYVKEVNSVGTKDKRAKPIAVMYEQGRVSHSRTANLKALELLMTTWEPDFEKAGRLHQSESPNPIDAVVMGAWELEGLFVNAPDLAQGFVGLEAAGRVLAETPRGSIAGLSALTEALRGRGYGGSI